MYRRRDGKGWGSTRKVSGPGEKGLEVEEERNENGKAAIGALKAI